MTNWQALGLGFVLGFGVGFLILRTYWAKEIAIAKQLYQAGYTKAEQVAAFIRSHV